MMVKADMREFYRAYRFSVMYRNSGGTDWLPLAVSKIKTSAAGLEIWAGDEIGEQTLFSLLTFADTIKVELIGDKKIDGTWIKTVEIGVDNLRCLPIDLDAMSASVAMQGVLFEINTSLSWGEEVCDGR